MVFALTVLPGGAHGHGVFAHGDADAEGGAEIHAHRFDGVVEVGIFAGFAGGHHPVGRQFDFAERANVGGGHVGKTFADGHAAGGGGVENGDGGAFAHAHGFAGGGVHG